MFKQLVTLSLFFILNPIPEIAQSIGGRVIDSETHTELPYVNIGILHGSVGTVSDVQGFFKLDLSKTIPTDTLKISCLGYEPLTLLVLSLINIPNAQNTTWELTPRPQALTEVVIKPREVKTKILGNKIRRSMMAFGYMPYNLGTEAGVVLKFDKNNIGHLKTVNFNINYNAYDSVIFRVKLYEYKNDSIGTELLKESIIIKSSTDSEILTVNVQDNHILVQGNTFLSLEWVGAFGDFPEKQRDHCHLSFYANNSKNKSYRRYTSQSDWEELSTNPGFWAEISYSPPE